MSRIEGPWNGIVSPCKDCTKRHTKCHSKCSDYKAYVEENNRVREAKNQEERLAFNPRIKHRGRRWSMWR